MREKTLTLCAYDKKGAVGGPVEWAADFATFLNENGWAVHVLILCQGGRPSSTLADRLGRIGIQNEVFDSGLADSLEAETEWILSEWKRNPTAYFVANLVLPAMYAARWIRDAGARTVAVAHSDPAHDQFYADVLSTFVGGDSAHKMSAVVAVSNSIAAHVKSLATADVRIVAIPCGTRITQARAVAPGSSLRLIYAGRLVEKAKRIRELVQALLAASEIPGVVATICGDGEEREWVTDALAGQSAVRYVGLVPAAKIHETMAEHHAIVLLSDFEGLPIAVMEAMACGVVPICLDSSTGTREIVQNRINGLLVSDRNESFIAAVKTLQDPTEWSRLSHEAKRTADERYSHDVVMQQWVALLESIDPVRVTDLGRIPRRIRLRAVRPVGTFASYPPCRPSELALLTDQVRRSWTTFRIAIRPRARIMAVVNRAKGRL
jgi:colanic acid/amylovoran biosynthesis glycosyltransferase